MKTHFWFLFSILLNALKIYIILNDCLTKKLILMAYHSVKSPVYHLYKKCTVGNNIESDNLKNGTGGKRLCSTCAAIKAGDRRR